MILAIGPFQILLILLCIGILFLPQIFFLITLQNTIKEVSIENRTIQPSQVWLTFIPLFGIFWQFVMVNRISKSIAAEFSKRNITTQSEKPGYSLGLTYCILLCCSVIPGIGALLGLAGFVVMIIYWVKINDYKNLLRKQNMGILNTIFGTSSSSEDDKYVLYLWAAINVATVDGVADEEEENKIYEFFHSDLGFSTERYDKIRNRADREGAQVFSKAKNLNDDDKMELINFLVDIATSDGHFHGEELVYIVGVGVLLGLNFAKLYNHLTENFEIDPDEVKIASERIKKNMNQ